MNNEEIYKMIDGSDTPLTDAIGRIENPLPKGWTITNNTNAAYRGPWTWEFSHENYDHACDQAKQLCGTGISEDDCKEQIIDFELEHPYFNEET